MRTSTNDSPGAGVDIDDPEQEELGLRSLGFYGRAYRVQLHQEDGNIDRMDPVDEATIGRLDIGALFDAAPEAARHALRRVLSDRHPMRIGPDDEGVLVDRAAFEAACQKRGVSLGIAPAVQDVLEAFAQQQEDGKKTLFKFYNGEQFACAGAFFVEKSNGLLRIIVDAREANAWMAPPGNNFTMVTVEQITSVFARLRAAHERFYTVTADLRHWFHQMGLPMRWLPFFICKLRANRFVKPVATPME